MRVRLPRTLAVALVGAVAALACAVPAVAVQAETLLPPVVTSESFSGVTPFAAHLEAVVDAENQVTSCEFEYGHTNTYGKSAVCEPASIEGFGEQGVGASVLALEPASSYHFRVVLENAAHERAEGADQELTTLTAEAPKIISEAVTRITSGEPKLEAHINPNYQQTSYRFEYSAQATGEVLEGPITVIEGAPPAPLLAAVFEEPGLPAGPVDLGPIPPEPAYFYRVVATNATGTTKGPVESFPALAAPAVATGEVTSFAPTSAAVLGTVNTAGAETTYHFAYISQAGYEAAVSRGEAPFTLSKRTAPTSVEAGYETRSTGSVPITELSPSTTYHYELVATNIVGTITGADRTFTTAPPTPPAAVTGGAFGVSQLSATVTGTIDGRGLQLSAQFEFGTVPYAGALVPATVLPGEGSERSIAASFEGNLQPDTIYYFRALATTSEGTAYGALQSFTTAGFPITLAPATVLSFIPYASIAELNAKEAKETPKPQATTPLTNARKRANALKACDKKPKKRRASCRRQAKRRYR